MSPLAPYVPDAKQPWTLARVHHLHWRASFGATWTELKTGVERGHEATLQTLLSGKREAGVPERANEMIETLQHAARTRNSRWQALWFWRMLRSADPLGERLTLLWHDHFATSYEKVQDMTMMGEQNATFRAHSRGSFRDLLPACVKQPAMLLWLDAASNYREHPNENLARELMELFTLGEGHYTEHDVREVARALTGWRVDRDDKFWFYGEHHDQGEKTVLGKKGTLDGDGVLAILLDHEATAARIAWRLCHTFLVESLVAKELLDALARELRDSGLDLGRAVERILRSRVFFCDTNLHAMPAPPAVHVTALARALECFEARTSLLDSFAADSGQHLFHPPSVFGWPHGKQWITTGSLVGRTKFARALVDGKLTAAGGDGPVAPLLRRHGVGTGAAERVGFFTRLLLGREPEETLRTVLVATAAAGRPRACEEMVVQLCSSPAFQLA